MDYSAEGAKTVSTTSHEELYKLLREAARHLFSYKNAKAICLYEEAVNLIGATDCNITALDFCVIVYTLCVCYYTYDDQYSLKACDKLIALIISHGQVFPTLYYGLALICYDLEVWKSLDIVINEGLRTLTKMSNKDSFRANWPTTEIKIPETDYTHLTNLFTNIKERARSIHKKTVAGEYRLPDKSSNGCRHSENNETEQKHIESDQDNCINVAVCGIEAFDINSNNEFQDLNSPTEETKTKCSAVSQQKQFVVEQERTLKSMLLEIQIECLKAYIEKLQARNDKLTKKLYGANAALYQGCICHIPEGSRATNPAASNGARPIEQQPSTSTPDDTIYYDYEYENWSDDEVTDSSNVVPQKLVVSEIEDLATLKLTEATDDCSSLEDSIKAISSTCSEYMQISENSRTNTVLPEVKGFNTQDIAASSKASSTSTSVTSVTGLRRENEPKSSVATENVPRPDPATTTKHVSANTSTNHSLENMDGGNVITVQSLGSAHFADLVVYIQDNLPEISLIGMPIRTFRRIIPSDLPAKPCNKDDDCAICLDIFGESAVTTLQCRHSFHKHCLERWIEAQNNCPLCKTYIVL